MCATNAAFSCVVFDSTFAAETSRQCLEHDI